MIIIIDYGIGNIGSIIKMIGKIGYQAEYSDDFEKIEKATHLILPGVGSFDRGMRGLCDKKLLPILKKKITEDKTPLLGICLGMQMLMERSEEGNEPGLGWIQGEVKKFRLSEEKKIPHMGWNNAVPNDSKSIFRNMENARFYFVHSYYVKCTREENILSETEYGIVFSSAVSNGNIFGVQFHPEKSHKYGMQLLRNFMEM